MLKYIPKHIKKEVLELYKYIHISIIKYNKKNIYEKLYEKYDKKLMLKLLHIFQNTHYFNNKFSINKKYWVDDLDYYFWCYFNQKHTYNKYTGHLSNNDTHNNIIKPILGDIIYRQGVSDIYILEHWGIYVGNYKNIGYIAEIKRDIDKTSNRSIITITPLHKFIVSSKYPLQIKNTISINNDGSYTDNRVINRQITLWTILLTLRMNWLYNLSINNDQTCQSYVNILIKKQLYTTQYMNALFYIYYIINKKL